MILTDREISIAIKRGQITIDPPPDEKAFSSTSVDLTLGETIVEFDVNPGYLNGAIDPTHPDFDFNTALSQISEKKTISSKGYELEPGKLILAWTVEEVRLPIDSRVAARVEGKSSLARLGLCVHLTAPTIHAGFQGYIQLEVINHGPRKILLKPSMRVCQLIFETTLGTPEKGYSGKFLGQTS
ncbi:dCTP deaminase [Azorhizobium oxalatiphilum]|uniref:dCTP deaminase n=1 Tax=Azorhizobium oxalatiphilum TaxID=980631 RepID=A0A917FHR5_9HYPH|nr:dCTP deaminase [Azorhizobium oxalatiphilum]GGF82244.1 dCTP deaminase [Azorhizobium oxalatiphilum]